MQGVAQGQSWFIAAGDTGAFACGGKSTALAVYYPGSSPFVTDAGGTNLTLNSSGSIATETAWSFSGGGSSVIEPLPAWEFGSPYFANGRRWVADYSMDADPRTGMSVFLGNLGNKWYVAGGTSVVAPLGAALAASISQYKGTRLGLFAVRLNQLANSRHLYRIVLHDITSGNNGYYSAGPGWDPPTGWGSPDGYMLMLKGLGSEREYTERWGYEKRMVVLREQLSDAEIEKLAAEGAKLSDAVRMIPRL